MLTPAPEPAPAWDAETDLAALRAVLATRLDAPGRAWLERALDEAGQRTAPAATTPAGRRPALPRWELAFVSAGRHCRETAPHPAEPAAPGTATAGPDSCADAARVLLLCAVDADAATVTRLYQRGTAAERRAVLYALPHLDLGPDALPLVEDALRTHDTRLIGAAVGRYAATWLDPHAWRHAVLKCLFSEVPLTAVADLRRRADHDAELARMLVGYARERACAGRSVPADLRHALDLTGVGLSVDEALAPPAAAGGPGTGIGTRTGTTSTDSDNPLLEES